MLWRMRSRVVAVGLGVAMLLGMAACGSSGGGTGASPVTTIKLGPASYQTMVPILTSPPTVATVPGVGGASVPNEQSYVIVSGDYLYGIAKRFCVKAEDIATYNGWTDDITTHQLVPGETLKIPPNGCAPGTVTEATAVIAPTVATAVATTTTFDVAIGGTYTVADGDTLSGIAGKTGTTVAGIVAANGWADENHVIYKGLKIKLPAKTG